MNPLAFASLIALGCCIVTLGDGDLSISSVATNENGFLVHKIDSPFQADTTQLRVLLPDELAGDRRYPALYILPVEAQGENRYGDGLVEVKKHNLHNKHQAVFVAPSFSHLPWYADHPTDPTIRQESYFLKVIVPFVEKTYPVSAQPKDRLLLGFSKSGWGAWSVLLRHPEVFGRAAAWDAPLMMDGLGKFHSETVFGNEDNFNKYEISGLLRTNAHALVEGKRLVLTGFSAFRPNHQQVHTLMDELKISHEYRDGPQRKHDWHSGWMPEVVELLAGSVETKDRGN